MLNFPIQNNVNHSHIIRNHTPRVNVRRDGGLGGVNKGGQVAKNKEVSFKGNFLKGFKRAVDALFTTPLDELPVEQARRAAREAQRKARRKGQYHDSTLLKEGGSGSDDTHGGPM